MTHLDRATVVSLNSAAPHRAIVGGRLRDAQLDFAAQAFADGPGDVHRILVTHHAMVPAPDYRRERPVPGVARILTRLRAMGVELVLSGHLHRSFVASSLDAYPHRAPEGPIWLAHSGTATSSRGRTRERGENTVNRIEVHQEHLVVEHFIYSGERGFTPFERRTVPRRGTTGVPTPPRAIHARAE